VRLGENARAARPITGIRARITPVHSDLLATYLNDHLAGAVGLSELLKRARGSNAGTELGEFLERLEAEVAEDRAELERLMGSLGIRRDPVKRSAAWTAEKFGRLKLNGRIVGYSPLSRLIELEALTLGLTGKLALWRSLGETLGPRAAEADFPLLAERAERQLAEVEPHRLEAARMALAEKAAS
jgi:hypothetical protein